MDKFIKCTKIYKKKYINHHKHQSKAENMKTRGLHRCLKWIFLLATTSWLCWGSLIRQQPSYLDPPKSTTCKFLATPSPWTSKQRSSRWGEKKIGSLFASLPGIKQVSLVKRRIIPPSISIVSFKGSELQKFLGFMRAARICTSIWLSIYKYLESNKNDSISTTIISNYEWKCSWNKVESIEPTNQNNQQKDTPGSLPRGLEDRLEAFSIP